MKKIIYMLMAVFTSHSLQAQQKFTIKGNLTAVTEPMKVFLSYSDGGKYEKDSVITIKGQFQFSGIVSRPVKASLSLRKVDPGQVKAPKIGDVVEAPDWADLMIDPGVTEINGPSLTKATIKGGKSQEEYLTYTKTYNQAIDSIVKIWQAQRKTFPEDSAASFKRLLYARNVVGNGVVKDFILSHGDSYVAFDIVSQNSVVIEQPKEAAELFNALSSPFKESAAGKIIAERIRLATKFSIGAPAVDFSQTDDKGKTVSLSDFKGKYVLIDFWASWCGPCRMEYPFLRKAYNKFKDQNFEIVGVSLDDSKSLWLNAIKDNNFNWTELCDLKGRKNEVAVAYGVAAIPQSFLIDPNGRIIAKNLRGNDLLDKLNEVISASK